MPKQKNELAKLEGKTITFNELRNWLISKRKGFFVEDFIVSNCKITHCPKNKAIIRQFKTPITVKLFWIFTITKDVVLEEFCGVPIRGGLISDNYFVARGQKIDE